MNFQQITDQASVQPLSPGTALAATPRDQKRIRTERPARNYQGEFAALVKNLLKFRTPGGTFAGKYKDHFQPVLGFTSLKELRRGTCVHRAVIKSFSNIPQFNPIDRAEIFIRWGEAQLGEDVFNEYRKDHEVWDETFVKDAAEAFALAWPIPGTSLHHFMWERLHFGPNRPRVARKKLTVRYAAKLLGKSETGMYRSLKIGGMKVAPFKALRNRLSLPEKQKRYFTQLYIESQVGQEILDFSQADFIKYYDTGVHLRLVAWIIGNSRTYGRKATSLPHPVLP